MQKRRTLPMRPSPISIAHMQNLYSHVVPTPTFQPPTTITPVDSDEDLTPSEEVQALSYTPSHIRHTSLIELDQDTPTEDQDMSDCAPLMSPPSFIVSPPTAHRLPTPISHQRYQLRAGRHQTPHPPSQIANDRPVASLGLYPCPRGCPLGEYSRNLT